MENKAPPTVSEDLVHDHPGNLDVHKSMGPDEMYPRVPKELALTKLLSMIFKESWQSGKVPGDWKRDQCTYLLKENKEQPWELPTCQPHLCAWEGHGTDPPRRHMMDRAVLHQDSRHQHSFSKGRSSLTSLVAFYDGMTTPVDKGRCTDVIYLGFSKVFVTAPYNLLSEVERDGFDGWTVGWLRSCLGSTSRG